MQPHTSILAHNSIKADGTDRKHQDIVYNTLKGLRGEMGTCADIATKCNLDYNAVGRRLGELVKDNKIYIFPESGGKSPNKRACRIYKVVTGESRMEEQGSLFAA